MKGQNEEKSMDRKIKVLEVLHGLANGGMPSFAITVAENIDKDKFQVDFALATDYPQFHEERVLKNGNRIFKTKDLASLKDKWTHFIRLIKLIKREKYDVVHSQFDYFNGVNLLAAWIAGVPIRISHSHNTRSANASSEKTSFAVSIYHAVMGGMIKLFSTIRLGCSDEANKWMYGKKWKKDKHCHVVYNAVDTQRFDANKYDKKKEQEKLGLDSNDLNLLTVGRLCEQKNSLFIVDIVRSLYEKDKNIHFTWVSTGALEQQVKEKVSEYNLNKVITFLGKRTDIPQIMAAHDALIFPSKWEGLGIALIEAQYMGLPCFASDQVPEQAQIGGVDFISLSKSADEWADIILKSLHENNTIVIDKDKSQYYKTEYLAKDMEKYYLGKG